MMIIQILLSINSEISRRGKNLYYYCHRLESNTVQCSKNDGIVEKYVDDWESSFAVSNFLLPTPAVEIQKTEGTRKTLAHGWSMASLSLCPPELQTTAPWRELTCMQTHDSYNSSQSFDTTSSSSYNEECTVSSNPPNSLDQAKLELDLEARGERVRTLTTPRDPGINVISEKASP